MGADANFLLSPKSAEPQRTISMNPEIHITFYLKVRFVASEGLIMRKFYTQKKSVQRYAKLSFERMKIPQIFWQK